MLHSTRRYFAHKIVLITGGSSGIGKASARLLTEAGASVIILARNHERLARTAEELRSLTTEADQFCASYAVDVSENEPVQETVRQIMSDHGRIDMLINSAGVAMPGYVEELSLDIYREMMDVNYFGTLHSVRAVLPAMLQRKSGHIATIGSVLSFMGVFGYSAYAPSKFAVAGLSQCLRAELRPYTIRVSLLCPPDVDTPQFHKENPYKPSETKALSKTSGLMSARNVALRMASGMAQGAFMILPNRETRLLYGLVRWFPGLTQRLMDSRIKKINSGR